MTVIEIIGCAAWYISGFVAMMFLLRDADGSLTVGNLIMCAFAGFAGAPLVIVAVARHFDNVIIFTFKHKHRK